jgi:hypothetical protein
VAGDVEVVSKLARHTRAAMAAEQPATPAARLRQPIPLDAGAAEPIHDWTPPRRARGTGRRPTARRQPRLG